MADNRPKWECPRGWSEGWSAARVGSDVELIKLSKSIDVEYNIKMNICLL